MIPAVEERADELKRLCRIYGVRRLDLFGSASTGLYEPDESDLDFLCRGPADGPRCLCGRLFRAAGSSRQTLRAARGPRGGNSHQESSLHAVSGADEDSDL